MKGLVTLRMQPWQRPGIEPGQYLRHRGKRARTAYFVVFVREVAGDCYICQCERLPIADIPEEAAVRLFQWHPRRRKEHA